MTIPADANGPKSVSVVCSECGRLIKPEALMKATPRRVDRPDGTWALQYDHTECPYRAPVLDAPPMAEFMSRFGI